MNTIEKLKNITSGALLALVAIAGLNSCSKDTVFITLNYPNIQTLEKGDTIYYKAKVQNTGDEPIDTTVTWSSVDGQVAPISPKGMLVAADTGKTIITATLSNGKYAMADVVVRKSKKLDVVSKELFLQVSGKDSLIQANVMENLMKRYESIEWKSSDTTKLKIKTVVRSDGKSVATVTPLLEGDVKLIICNHFFVRRDSVLANKKDTVVLRDTTTYSDTCLVHVGAVVSMTWQNQAVLLKKSVSIFTDEATKELPVYAVISPDIPRYVNGMDYIWKTSNASVVAIESVNRDPNNPYSSICHLKPVSAGTATVTVTANGQTVTAYITVKNRNDYQVKAVTLDKHLLTVNKDKFEQLKCTVSPTGVNFAWPVVWSSSNPSIASVDNEGRVTGLAAGTVYIYAKAGIGSASGVKSDSCLVTVVEVVNSILINTDSRNVLMVGDQEIWTAAVNPASASNQTVWTSSDPSVATVTNSGKITALSAGTTIITVKAGDKSDSRTLQVVPLKPSVDFGSSYDNGGWELASDKKLRILVDDNGGNYEMVFGIPSALTNKVYNVGSDLTAGTFTWKNSNVTANITSGTVEVKAGSNSDYRTFIFNLNIQVGTQTIKVTGSGELYAL